MIKFYGYNDGRAIAVYNKRNLTRYFFWFALICTIISIISISISVYELLYIWGAFLFILLIALFALSFGKYDDEALKANGIKTKHLFIIDNFKLFKNGCEVKGVKYIKYYVYKTYIFLELKESYYYIPIEELPVEVAEFTERLMEVLYGISIDNIIENIKEYINQNNLSGNFEYDSETIIWYLGEHKFTYYIDLPEIHFNHEKLKFNKYHNYDHNHIDFNDVINHMEEINKRFGNCE